MKRILFRADAKPSIGIGDLMSLINLSHYFNPREWECFFMIKAYPAGIRLIDRVKKDNAFILDESISIENEVAKINHVIQMHKINVLFFEITERALSEYVGLTSNVKKACVNFNAHLLEDLDLVVNWDVNAISYMRQQDAPNANFLLGPEYVILPKNFYELKRRSYKIYPETLLVAMGGADEHDLTFDIIKCMIDNKIKLTINIVVGSGYQYTSRLEKLLEKSLINWEIKYDVKSMLDEYLNCDMAIGTGGLTASEIVATKTPAMLIATYEHQVARCQYFHDKGYVKYLGFRSFDTDELLNGFNHLPINSNKNIFNTEKVVDEIKKIARN